MSYGNIEFPQAQAMPRIEVARFSASPPEFTQHWQEYIGANFGFISDRYWTIDGSELPVFKSIGLLMLGVIQGNQLGEIGNSCREMQIGTEDITRPITCLGMIARLYAPLKDNPEALTTRLITTTNEHLAAIGSPIQLPLDVERSQVETYNSQL